MYEFVPTVESQLALAVGEVVWLIDDTGMWWKVRNASSQEGLVPSNYLADQATVMAAATTAAAGGGDGDEELEFV